LNGGIPQPWQDVEGSQLEVPFPPIHTKGGRGYVKFLVGGLLIVPCGTSYLSN
jgi:hypothetical protein